MLLLYNPAMPNLTGQMLGKVRVDMFLARGGMADVFVGTHTTLHRAVAIKFLKGDLQDEPELRERFEREARVIAMLRHPNIVQVYDFDTHENQPYLVMEYVPGASLGSYLRELHKNKQRLEISQVVKLTDKLANALQYAHDNDVVHRDIKPANILLTSRTTPVEAGQPLPTDTEPIITDFGLVRFTQSNKQTSTGVITGTPAYMSPEQARGDHVDARTDVYSLGVTVYEMLAGRIPFESDSTLSLLHKQIYDPPPPIEGISEALQDVMNRALAKTPEERFSTPMEFANAFQGAISGTTNASTLYGSSPSQVHTMQQATVVSTPKRTSNRLNLAFIGIGMLVILTGAILFSGKTPLAPVVLPTNTVTVQPTETSTLPPSPSPTETMPAMAEPIGLLHFKDAPARAGEAILSTSGMPLPPAGSQYEVWLIKDDNEQRRSLGYITFDENNNGTLSYVDNEGTNLIGQYHAVEITIEPIPDSNPNPSGQVAFATALPANSFTHVRHLLSSFSSNPNGTAFLDGLNDDSKLITDAAGKMLASLEAHNDKDVRLQAEQMLNIIVGNKDSNYKDWNGNGKIDDPSDGFGLLLNGDNEGYIEGSLSHAKLASTAPDATENIRTHGEHVAIAVTNVGEWTPELRDLLISILNSPRGTDVEALVRQAVALANQIRVGTDINGNENIEPILGEGGVLTAYQHAYYMADIYIFAEIQEINLTPMPTMPSNYGGG